MTDKSLNFNHYCRVVCPYYQGENGEILRCESPIRNSEIIIAFNAASDRRIHKNNFCNTGNWKYCPIAEKNESKYEKES